MKLTTSQKIKSGLALGVVFLVIMATNLIDKNNFRIIQETTSTIYEDRLLAKEYLYKMCRLLDIRKMELAMDSTDSFNPQIQINDSLRVLTSGFAKTKLTRTEKQYLENLETKISDLSKFESNLANDDKPDSQKRAELLNRLEVILEDIDQLADIQVVEGKRARDFSDSAIERSDLMYKLEIGALFIIALIIQLLIFVKPLK